MISYDIQGCRSVKRKKKEFECRGSVHGCMQGDKGTGRIGATWDEHIREYCLPSNQPAHIFLEVIARRGYSSLSCWPWCSVIWRCFFPQMTEAHYTCKNKYLATFRPHLTTKACRWLTWYATRGCYERDCMWWTTTNVPGQRNTKPWRACLPRIEGTTQSSPSPDMLPISDSTADEMPLTARNRLPPHVHQSVFSTNRGTQILSEHLLAPAIRPRLISDPKGLEPRSRDATP